MAAGSHSGASGSFGAVSSYGTLGYIYSLNIDLDTYEYPTKIVIENNNNGYWYNLSSTGATTGYMILSNTAGEHGVKLTDIELAASATTRTGGVGTYEKDFSGLMGDALAIQVTSINNNCRFGGQGSFKVTITTTCKTYTFTVNAGTGGTAKADLNKLTPGESTTITATPSSSIGYKFDKWTAVGGTVANSTSAVTTFTMTSAGATDSGASATASFVLANYSVTVNADPLTGGTPTASKTTAKYNDAITLTQTASNGYRFDGWVVKDANSADVTVSNNSFSMPASDVTATAYYTKHTLAWNDGASLSAEQVEYQLTFTLTGSASENMTESGITYTIYKTGSETSIATIDSDSSVSITLTDDDLEQTVTYYVVASSTYNKLTIEASNSPVCEIELISVHKTLKYYDGTQWVECVAQYYDGNNWIEVEPYYYNGTDWVLCSHT